MDGGGGAWGGARGAAGDGAARRPVMRAAVR